MTEVNLNPGKVHLLATGVFADRIPLLRDRDNYLAHLQKEAAFSIGATLLRTASLHTFRKAKPEDLPPDNPFHYRIGEYHTWTVGVIAPDDTQRFAKQLDQARRDGLREAAKIVRAQADIFRSGFGIDGHMILQELKNAAQQIEAIAIKDNPS